MLAAIVWTGTLTSGPKGVMRPEIKSCTIIDRHCGTSSSTWRAGRFGVGLAAMLVTGCSANSNSGLVNALSSGSVPTSDSASVSNPPTVVYAMVAQNALTCWMGPKGPFKQSHIFHADAASPTQGGQAEIVLHEREISQPHPWGKRSFRIELAGLGGGTDTRVTMLNINLPSDLAEAVRADVTNWAKGGNGCQAQVARPPPPDPVPVVVAPPKVKAKGKNSNTG